MIALLLCTLLAAASDDPSAGPALPPSVETVAIDDTPGAALDEAWRHVRLGDGAGARRLADDVARRAPSLAAEAAYLTAVAWELDDDEAALTAYDALLDGFPASDRAQDARFRRALVLAHVGRLSEAERALGALRPWSKLPIDDQHKVALSRATWRLERHPSPGTARSLQRTLDAVPAGSVTWYEATAHLALLHHAAAASQDGALDGPERSLKHVLDERATALQSAEAELEPLVALAASEPLLDGLVSVATAYEVLAEDVLAAPVPDTLPPTEQDRYRSLVTRRGLTLLMKARAYADLAVEHAGRVAWEGPEAGLAGAVLQRITRRVEDLDR